MTTKPNVNENQIKRNDFEKDNADIDLEAIGLKENQTNILEKRDNEIEMHFSHKMEKV